MGELTRKEKIMAQGKHNLPEDYMKRIDQFFNEYDEEMTQDQATKRYVGIYGTNKGEVLKKKRLQQIWHEFLTKNRIDYITANNEVGMEDILSIGIDKFVRTNGWEKPSDVARWRTNVVRVGVCPECRDQFIPLIMQTNHGLCKECRPKFSGKAIKRFIEHTIATNQRYEHASQDALMDFFIMFYKDDLFRSLFRKGSVTAEEYENREYEIPEWLKLEQERNAERMQQQLTNMVPESGQ